MFVSSEVSPDCRGPKRAGAKLQRQTLLSSGDTAYKHLAVGHLRALAGTKKQTNKNKKNK